ncbi:MAG TPA: ATP-binding protein [Thermoanaerobaculia bacterium]|nr:ATP-binding protein [Thermoanaerobaculia bacterium]
MSSPVSASVTRDLGALAEIARLVDGFFGATAAHPTTRYPIELALEEIFTNMVRHNAAGRSDIRIELDIRDGEVIATVTDFDAPRFDPTTDAPPPAIERQLELRTPGGLGIHLVKKMIDRIEYSHHDRTATVTLHKRAT